MVDIFSRDEMGKINEAGFISLADFLKQKGCCRTQVYRRADIHRVKINGRVFVHRSALAVNFRGHITPHERAEMARKNRINRDLERAKQILGSPALNRF